MDNWLILNLICLIILIGLSAFFSGSEAALFSLSRLNLKQLGQQGEKIAKLLHHPHQLLTVLLIGTTIVNITASSLGTIISIRIFTPFGVSEAVSTGIAIGGMTLLILIFGEIIPITWGVTKGSLLAPRVTPVVKALVSILAPLRIILSGITNLVVAIVERHRFFTKETPGLTDEEIKTMVDLSSKAGVLGEHERRMIHSIFEVGETTVAQVMRSAEKMVWVKINTPFKEVFNLFKLKGHSRMPVYNQSLDNIVGIINAKDFLTYFSENQGMEGVIPQPLIKRPYFVSGSIKINQLLRELQKRRMQMAIVQDRDKQIIGLVTIEDLLEEIVGEIHDEYEKGRVSMPINNQRRNRQ